MTKPKICCPNCGSSKRGIRSRQSTPLGQFGRRGLSGSRISYICLSCGFTYKGETAKRGCTATYTGYPSRSRRKSR